MKISILGDTHFGVRNDSKIFHEYYERFYDKVFFPELIKRNVRTIIQLGDLFDRRKYINFLSLTESRRYFFDKCKEYQIHVHALIGNHDIFWRESLTVNSPGLLLRDYDNITLWQDVGTLEIDGVKIDMVPWICKDNKQKIYEFIHNSSAPICVGHFELAGFNLSKGIQSHNGVDSKFLSNYVQVYSGHYHTYSNQNNITYLGTPYELFWSDYKDKKYFGIFDTKDMYFELVENPLIIFYKINYDDRQFQIKHLNTIDYNKYHGAYIKIVVVNKQNPYLFDKFLDKLYKHTPADITIVEDFTDIKVEETDIEIVDQAQDTMTILSNFIDGQSLNISDTNKLKSLMRELYVEALSTENIE
jgi:DNA repair exonuclease SbcCD nuclease subunit